MSYQATDYVLQLRGLTVTEKAVAFVLACHANEDGSNIYPSKETVARESGLAFRQNASEIVRQLEEKKIIQAMSEKIGGRSGTTRYRFPGVPEFNLTKLQSTTALTSDKRNPGLRKCSPELPKVQSTTPKVQSTTARIVLNSKENSKEENGSSSFPLATEKHGQRKSPETGNQGRLVCEFFVWLPGEFPGLFLSEKQKDGLADAIAAADYELPVLKEAARTILQNLDLSNSFDCSQGRTSLVANLLDVCETVSRDRQQRAQERELMAAAKIRIERDAADERAKRVAEREAEEIDDIPVWEEDPAISADGLLATTST